MRNVSSIQLKPQKEDTKSRLEPGHGKEETGPVKAQLEAEPAAKAS